MAAHRITTGINRVALICGSGPLLLGLSIFLLWLVTRWDWLMMAGIITIYGGVGLFCVGVVALFHFYGLASEISESELPRRRFWSALLFCLGLLLANFPAALGIIVAADLMHRQYVVVVRNETTAPLEQVHIFGGGCDVTIETIAAGESARCRFWIKTDGELRFEAIADSVKLEAMIEGYVSSGMGGRYEVTVQRDGSITVTNTAKQ